MSAEDAAAEAGYRRSGIAEKLLTERAQQNERGQTESIADSSEILRMLTSVMRGDVHDPVVVVEQRTGKEGKTEKRARVIKKSASVKERMSAAEMLARRYGILEGDGEDSGVILVGEERFTDAEDFTDNEAD